MTEMDQLARLRAEVPARVSPEAERRFHAAMSAEPAQPAVRPARGRPWQGRLSLPRLAGTAGIAAGLAAAVTAGLVLAVPHSPAKPSAASLPTVQELAYRASTAALAQKAVSPGQWLYYKSTLTESDNHNSESGDWWQTADFRKYASYNDGPLKISDNPVDGGLYISYADLAKLPSSPQALLDYVAKTIPRLPSFVASNPDLVGSMIFGQLGEMFREYDMPPQIAAEILRAMPYIPGVTVEKVPGGVAFTDSTKMFGSEEIVLDPSSYAVTAVVTIMGSTKYYANINRVPVSGPGVRP